MNQRVAFGPFEICVRADPCCIAEGYQYCGDCIRGGGATGAENAVTVYFDAFDPQNLTKFGGVHDVDLEKKDVCRSRDRIDPSLLPLFLGVLGFVARLAAVGDDVELVVVLD